MNKKKKWLNKCMVLFICVALLLPVITIPTMAGSLVITDVKQGGGELFKDDNFSLIIKLASEGSAYEVKKSDYVPNISVFGSAVDSSNMTYDIKWWKEEHSDTKIPDEPDSPEEIIVRGLVYTGQGKKVTVGIDGVFKELTLNATTSDEGREYLKVDDSVNLLVKTDATQNVQVKVVNQGKQVLKNVKVKLQLDEKVEGVKIKTEEATISQIQAKEIKTASFSIEVDKEVKAKVYKATAVVNGVSFPVNLQVDSNVMPSTIEVSTEGNKVFKPGTPQDMTLMLKNVGERAAKNIRVEVESDKVAIVGGSNVKHFQVLNAKESKNWTLKFNVNSEVTTSSVPVKVNLTFLNSLGEETKDTQTIYLATNAAPSLSSDVVIGQIISPSGVFGVNENFNIQFDISAPEGAQNLRITVKGDEGIVPKSQNVFSVPKLKAGEKKHYSVTLAATRAAVSSAHAIEVAIEYGTSDKPLTINQFGSVTIHNPEKDKEDDKDENTKKSGPKVIIGEYKVEPTIVKAGQEFNLAIGFLNTHQTQGVHNFKASLKVIEQGENDAGNVFTPVGASNTFFIADLAPGEIVTKNITLYTIPTAKPKTYEVTLEMEYEDEKGNELTPKESIGIPVEQVTEIEIGDIQVDPGQVGMPSYFNATLYNTGKTDITNVMVHIEGEGFTVQENKMYIGSFEKQMTENYAPTLIPDIAGTLTGNIIIEYEEATGEQKQIIKEFSFDVAEMMMPEDMGMEPGMDMVPQQPQAKWPLLVGVGAGVFVAFVITLVVLKKRKAKKEKMMLNEDD
ncbi:hypothetical protein CS063_02255 [Sporanaerobium hydrogeniformans]|uniref:Uncharacterized protein n=1 Tax=Sporanaerobium hydrogeniformans TaxID=3072179 RepID=A0AC61DGB3_9FIRM|nr:CARDB domain-containing protein [Sporanaerobium hydrogeniformans]PHV72319.1 hypothetical protein CS063_02255 [Sporanaerobium hydrogeniformans]